MKALSLVEKVDRMSCEDDQEKRGYRFSGCPVKYSVLADEIKAINHR